VVPEINSYQVAKSGNMYLCMYKKELGKGIETVKKEVWNVFIGE